MGRGGAGRRIRRATALACLALLVPAGASAIGSSFDDPASHDTSQQFTTPNVQRQDTPNDPNYDQAEPDTQQPADKRSTNLYDERFDLFGFSSALTPLTTIYHDGPNAGKGRQISGFNAAGAWKLTRGRPDVPIAILDTGIKWDRPSLRKRIHLNTGELPLPQNAAGVNATSYDLNGDGAVNVDDYRDDPRVAHAGPLITAEDLIKAFGHCQIASDHLIVGGAPCAPDGKFDNDGNGYANDIAGWDFFDDDNDPLDASSYFAASNHGSGRASDAAEEGNDGDGSIGVCPHCQLMPLRIWDTFVSDGNSFGQGILYATNNGAKVIEGANGSLYHSAFAEQASQYAYDHGVVQTFSGDDLNTGNHNYPANYGHAMLIEGTVPDTVGLGQSCPSSAGPLCDVFPATGTGTDAPPGTYFRGANTTQFGGKSSISMEGPTGSVNTGKAAGAAGLVVSAARDAGITLASDETREILEQTAEDVTPGNTLGAGTPDPAQVGWDTHFGWGRANVGAAVSVAADRAKIPDIAAIDSPDWYAPLTGKTLSVTGLADAPRTSGRHLHYKLEWGPGLSPTDAQWQPVHEADADGPVTSFGDIDLDTVRAQLKTFSEPPDPGGPIFSPTSPNPYQQQFTVRLTVTDPTTGATRIAGVDRRVFTAIDPVAEGLRPGFPKRMGTGGEAPVRYADLNGDNVQELIVPAEDGTVHAYEPDGSELPGWPVHTQLQLSAKDHQDAPGIAAVSAAGAPPREPPRGAAVADIDGDGKPEVIDTAGTHLYVWEGDGSTRPGFPVQSDLGNCGPAFERQPDRHLKCGFLASPTVADLDGDGHRTDIVVAALDGHVYAFNSDGSTVAHFPVQLVDPAMAAAHTEVLAESINQVAVGDLNGDGADDIVAGTNETYGATNSGDVSFAGLLGGAGQSTRVYAVDGKTGEFLPGWPISISGVIESTLPMIGPGADPALLTVGGQPKVLASATSGSLATYNADGSSNTTMRQEDSSKGNAVDKTPGLNLFESAAVGKLEPSAPNPAVVKYEISTTAAADLLLVGQNFPYNHLIGAWDSSTGAALPAYPTITDDYQFLSSSTVAKIDPASPANQIVAGTGLGLLHAYDGLTAQDAPGFPKQTGGWLFSPATISTDGRMADITREGYLFEWNTAAAECQSEWPGFRHDPQNSGNYNRDGTAPAAPGDVSLTSLGGNRYSLSFTTPGDDGFCGTAHAYVASARGQGVSLGDPGQPRSRTTKTLSLTPGSVLTFKAVDEAGNAGQPASITVPLPIPGGPPRPSNAAAPSQAGATGSACAAGTTVPRSSVSHRHLHISKRRVKLSGRAIEADCASGKLANGHVRRVLVSVARVHGARCRFLRRSGRLGGRRSCARPKYLAAHIRSLRGHRNKTLWTLRLRARIPRGRYLVTVRAKDASGHVETLARPTNTASLRVRPR